MLRNNVLFCLFARALAAKALVGAPAHVEVVFASLPWTCNKLQSPCNWVVTSQTTASTNRKGFGCKPSRCARCTTTTRRSAKLTNTTLASALISSIRSNNARTPAASECAVSKHERGICRVAASKQRATVQSAAAGCQAHSVREMRWHCRQRLPTPNASTLRRKTQHANGG